MALFDAATERIDYLQQQVQIEAANRAAAMALLYDNGMSYREIGAMVGLSAARVQQIISVLK